MNTYSIEIPGLADDIAKAPLLPKHVGLLAAMRRHGDLIGAWLVTTRGDAYLSRRKVLAADGTLVADDHEAWLAGELEKDGGSSFRTFARLKDLGYLLTRCDITTLYLVEDYGGPADNFVQIEVDVEDEFVDRKAFTYAWGRTPASLSELVEAAENGQQFQDGERVRHRPSSYRLRRAFNAAAFLREAQSVEEAARTAAGERIVGVSTNGGPTVPMRIADLAEDDGSYVWPGRRLVDDWEQSSAGRAGHRLCEHWALQISDYTSPKGERHMSVIPLWAHTRKIAELKRRPSSDYELFGKLESLSQRVGVPFGWYFYMLHGNLVSSWAGRAVLKAAEGGMIVLPEQDYRVLKRWAAREYGF